MTGINRAVVATLVLAALAPACAGRARAQDTVSIGTPGIPAVFIAVQVFVAQQEKLFEKFGVKVTIRQFDTGANAARAVIAGDVDLAISPTPLVVNMISNANADLVGIYGYEHPDWLLASMDPAKNRCEDLKGQPVAVDGVGAARSIALNQLLRSCGLTANDTQQVAVSANVGAAMIAGQLPFGVLHIDDVPVIERESGKKVTIILDINKVDPVSHYMTLVTARARIEKQRDALARVVAALAEATRFIGDPKNADRVAQAAAPTGRNPADAKASTKMYLDIKFWPTDGHGLPKPNIEAVIELQKKVGGIRPNATPVTYDRFVNTALYDDAVKLLGAKGN
jgi:NitT/TauT family transport system substrate-binding protein